MITITIILNDQKDKNGRYVNRQILHTDYKDCRKLTDKDAHAMAHDVTQGNYVTAWVNKTIDKD